MTYLFFVEDYTKYNFSIAEIVELSEFAKTTPNNSPNSQNNEMCMTGDFDVRNPDILRKYHLQSVEKWKNTNDY